MDDMDYEVEIQALNDVIIAKDALIVQLQEEIKGLRTLEVDLYKEFELRLKQLKDLTIDKAATYLDKKSRDFYEGLFQGMGSQRVKELVKELKQVLLEELETEVPRQPLPDS